MSFLESLAASFVGAFRGTGANQTGVVSPFEPYPSHLGQLTIENLWPGLDLAGIAPTRSTAMRVGSVAAARNRIVGPIAGMPLVAVGPGSASPLLAQPERGRPRAITLAWTVDQMLWHGRAWWQITERQPDGRPMAVVLRVEDSIAYDPERGTVTVDGGPPLPASEFVRIDAMHEGVLATGAEVITRAVLVEAAAAKASDNPVPSIELHQTDGPPLSSAEIDALVSRWARARRGANGGVAYTSSTVEVKSHGVAAEQLLITGRNAAALDVARQFGLPAWALDVSVEGSSLTYSNVPSRSRELLDYTLRPYMDAIEGRLGMPDVTAPGTEVRLDPVRLLRGDFADRMSAGKVAIDAGIYTADEIRALELEAPREEG